MGYVKKSIQEINKILDEKELPKKWNEFIENASKSENILIKTANKHLYCTNCQKEYKYINTPKNYAKCPFCHQKFDIKNWNLKRYTYNKNLILVENINGEYVLRVFDLKSDYSNKKWERAVIEFGRYFFKSDTELISQNVCMNMGSFYISHSNCTYNKNKWRTIDSYWKSLSTTGQVYHYNLKEMFKGTEYQYSQVWELAKHMGYMNMKNIMMTQMKQKSFELLIKAKLYNLACDSNKFYKGRTFEERFGISKNLYSFMKKHNIKLDELERLKLLKQPNIHSIKYLTNYSIDSLEDIQEYISLDKFIKYSKKIRWFDIHTYKDYLRFCKELGFNMKDKKILFPRTKRELDKKHDELEKQYQIQKDELMNEKIKKRHKELKINEYKDTKYLIKPAPTFHSLIDESKQQSNCVRTYAEKYANGKCDIYFMRYIKSPKKSLVTVEVKNNKVVQSRIKNNQLPDESEMKFLRNWETKILNKEITI